MTIINIDQIVSITIDERPLTGYVWMDKYTFLGITLIKEGVYNVFDKSYLGSKVPKGHVLVDGHIYRTPIVTLEFSNKQTRTLMFDNIEDADEFVDKIYIAKPLKLE